MKSSNIPSKPSIIKHADGEFYTRYFSKCYDTLTTLTGWRNKIASHALSGLKPGKLLDVGCGTGFLMSLARDKGFEVTGLDASRGMLEKARELHDFSPQQLILSEGKKMPLESGCFDIVIASGSLVHIPDIDETCAEMIRMAKPGGLIRIIDHAKPAEFFWNTPFFHLFSQFSGDIIHDYKYQFERHCALTNHKTLGRGGYMQCFDFRKN